MKNTSIKNVSRNISMKVVIISDTHTFHREPSFEIPDGDTLIHCGDFTMSGSIHEAFEFKDWFDNLPHQNKLVIGGNHDRCFGQDEMMALKMFTGSIYLHNSGIEIDGIKFWGSPMTPAFNGMRGGLTFYTNSEREAKGIWSGIPKDLDVLITHGPPWGILDSVPHWDTGEPEHVGDKMLLSKIIQRKPKYHVFGHIHEGYGIYKSDPKKDPYNGTVFVNASSVNARYNLVNAPIVIDI